MVSSDIVEMIEARDIRNISSRTIQKNLHSHAYNHLKNPRRYSATPFLLHAR
jgi:hypothetical protein